MRERAKLASGRQALHWSKITGFFVEGRIANAGVCLSMSSLSLSLGVPYVFSLCMSETGGQLSIGLKLLVFSLEE